MPKPIFLLRGFSRAVTMVGLLWDSLGLTDRRTRTYQVNECVFIKGTLYMGKIHMLITNKATTGKLYELTYIRITKNVTLHQTKPCGFTKLGRMVRINDKLKNDCHSLKSFTLSYVVRRTNKADINFHGS